MIPIKTSEELQTMRLAGRLTAQTLDMVNEEIKAGMTTGYGLGNYTTLENGLVWHGHDGVKMQGYNSSELWDTAFAVQAVLLAMDWRLALVAFSVLLVGMSVAQRASVPATPVNWQEVGRALAATAEPVTDVSVAPAVIAPDDAGTGETSTLQPVIQEVLAQFYVTVAFWSILGGIIGLVRDLNGNSGG